MWSLRRCSKCIHYELKIYGCILLDGFISDFKNLYKYIFITYVKNIIPDLEYY